jgi:PAS domain S-box-containing protein
MRRQRDRHLHAIETAREGISILDDERRFIYANQAYADLYGYDPDELIREHWELLESGYSTRSGTRFGLSIVVEIAEAHGWDVHTTEGTEGGARFEIRDIRSLREDDTDGRFQATSSRTP